MPKSALFCVLLAAGPAIGQAPSLTALRAASRARTYEPPTVKQTRAATALFMLLFSGGGEKTKIRELCRAISYETVTVFVGQTTVLVLREPPGALKGRGFFAFRVAESLPEGVTAAPRAKPVVLEAPHSYYDRYTGKIAELLFLEQSFTAAAWNTAHRHTTSEESADLCHTERSLLNAFTRAFAATFAKGVVVQLHAFSGSKRSAAREASSSAILSNGIAIAAPRLKTVAACLAHQFAGPVLVFPDDTGELGATTNEQGRLLRRLGRAMFLHIEFNLPARRLLKGDKRLRRKVGSCLRGIVP